MNGQVSALTVLPNGHLVAGGAFFDRVARWDGTAWSSLGSGMNNFAVRALTVLPDGHLVAGGDFTTAGGTSANRIARWDGTTWSSLGSGMDNSVSALTVLPNGHLVAGGSFTTAGANRIARWDGTTWSSLGSGLNGEVRDLAVLPNGDLVAGGSFTTAGGISANGIARWNGTTWSTLGSGMSGGVRALAVFPDGDLVAGGEFATAGAAASYAIARLTTTCPATSTSYGSGCPSSGGRNLLTATTLPWVDATFRATGTGLPSLALVVAVTGVAPIPQGSLPLTAMFAEGVPGCDVLVPPDILEVLVATSGSVQSQLFLPNTPPLAGVTFYHQMIPIEIDPQLTFLAVTSTNALQLVAGMF